MNRRVLSDVTNYGKFAEDDTTGDLKVELAACPEDETDVPEITESTVLSRKLKKQSPCDMKAATRKLAARITFAPPRRPASTAPQIDEDIPALVFAVAEDLCGLWAQSASEGGGARMQFALQKFGRLGPPQLMAALMSPPTCSPPSPPVNPEGADAGQREVWPPASVALDPESRADLDLQDLHENGSLLRPCHEQAEQARPEAEDIHRCLGPKEREQVVLWLAQVCILRGVSDSVLHASVMLLDRFSAVSKESLPMDRLHLIVIAILSTALKVAGVVAGSAGQPGQLKSLMEHLGQNLFSRTDIIHAELEVLEALSFRVATPSAIDFLEGFALLVPAAQLGLRQDAMHSPVMCVASFLIQLALGDATMLHRYPCAALAAGAVYIGLWCTQASPDRYSALLQEAALALASQEELKVGKVTCTPEERGTTTQRMPSGLVIEEV
eukprot:CAMPEP_0197648444 /NCGR_PEP_ID=MMETSP1338-20131121/27757_1 /TAXON_ID=43686 ORGANISM="Pelagodinium beii, Strain RCC1491" /NCGR_SAMPLE_ID=MMETSP1338 /ASSEMBLY_ACC=CAM_ASM_000754 /LENGTH=440 /DNA_ID=CAMNT_0043222441 /DNA_START=66 /DNA_END=1388 /DNA_ORIENTATION=-